MAVRLALGAGRFRLVQHLLVESVLLALACGMVGLALSAFGALVLALFASPETPEPVSTSPDLRILAFTFAVSALTGILFGLTPALRSTRPEVAPTLKDQAGSVLGGASARFRKALVASQLALSLLLMIGAGLFLRTLKNLLAVDVGFETRALLSFTVDPSLNGYTSERTKQFARELLQRLNTTPGWRRRAWPRRGCWRETSGRATSRSRATGTEPRRTWSRTATPSVPAISGPWASPS